MPITTAFCNQAKQDLFDGIHAAADVYMIALYNSSATLDATTTAYSATNECSGAGYTAGGVALSGRANAQGSGTAYLTFNNPSWANSTLSARGFMIYNASKSNKALAVFDFGAVISSTNGTFTVQMPTAAPATAILRLA